MAQTKHADREKRLVARADEVTERVTRIEASREAFDRMMTALDQPARSLPRLQRAADRYKETVLESDANPPAG